MKELCYNILAINFPGVVMAWQASETAVDLPEQKLTAPERNGFTVVEWGGTEWK